MNAFQTQWCARFTFALRTLTQTLNSTEWTTKFEFLVQIKITLICGTFDNAMVRQKDHTHDWSRQHSVKAQLLEMHKLILALNRAGQAYVSTTTTKTYTFLDSCLHAKIDCTEARISLRCPCPRALPKITIVLWNLVDKSACPAFEFGIWIFRQKSQNHVCRLR